MFVVKGPTYTIWGRASIWCCWGFPTWVRIVMLRLLHLLIFLFSNLTDFPRGHHAHHCLCSIQTILHLTYEADRWILYLIIIYQLYNYINRISLYVHDFLKCRDTLMLYGDSWFWDELIVHGLKDVARTISNFIYNDLLSSFIDIQKHHPFICLFVRWELLWTIFLIFLSEVSY